MKKFLKNAILIMLITCFVLNIINLIGQVIEKRYVTQEVIKIAEEVKNKGVEGEEAYQLLAQVYYAGYGNKLIIQMGILGLSIVLSIIIGMIVTFEEKSKIKLILKYILGMLIVALIPTLFNIFTYMDFKSLFSDFVNEILYNIEVIWIWYTLAFFMLYAIKIYITNKDTKKLNKILKDNNKREDEAKIIQK